MSPLEDFFLESNVGFGEKVYYNCSDVESKVTQFLAKLGALNVQVHCTGGIDDFFPPAAWEANVRVSYQTLRAGESADTPTVTADWKNIEFNSFGSCYLYSQVFGETKDTFEWGEAIRVNRCMSVDSNFHLKMKTLF